MHCINCEEELNDNLVRWSDDEPYCLDCFNDIFTFCSRCETVVNRESTPYDGNGDPLCNDCYEENYDDDAPDNPPVTETDRELVVKLSRSWLQGKVETKKTDLHQC